MKLKKIISIGSITDDLSGSRLTQHLTGNQRVSLLEEIRRDMVKIKQYEYPGRLRRILKVTQQKKG